MSTVIRIKALKANDLSGKYRYADKNAEDAGQFDHADSLAEIVQKVRETVHVRIEDWETGELLNLDQKLGAK